MYLLQFILVYTSCASVIKTHCIVLNYYTLSYNSWYTLSLYGFSRHLTVPSSAQCISAEPQTSQEPREEVEIDLCGIYDPPISTSEPPTPTGGNDASILPSMVTVALGLACVVGTLQLFQ